MLISYYFLPNVCSHIFYCFIFLMSIVFTEKICSLFCKKMIRKNIPYHFYSSAFSFCSLLNISSCKFLNSTSIPFLLFSIPIVNSIFKFPSWVDCKYSFIAEMSPSSYFLNILGAINLAIAYFSWYQTYYYHLL